MNQKPVIEFFGNATKFTSLIKVMVSYSVGYMGSGSEYTKVSVRVYLSVDIKSTRITHLDIKVCQILGELLGLGIDNQRQSTSNINSQQQHIRLEQGKQRSDIRSLGEKNYKSRSLSCALFCYTYMLVLIETKISCFLISIPMQYLIGLQGWEIKIVSEEAGQVHKFKQRYEPTKNSNCKVNDLKINMLEITIKILEARLELERHPEDHTCQSGAILYELLEDMKNLLGNEFDVFVVVETFKNLVEEYIFHLMLLSLETFQLHFREQSEQTKCSNFKVKDLKINMLETRIKILEARLELERHPEDHTCQSGAILYELLDDMENLCLE
ncbi:hypothetical protein Tco_1473971 [Tanacetum coccineum]